MEFFFPIVIIDDNFESENASGLEVRALAQALEEEGFEVLGGASYGNLTHFNQKQSRASAFVLSIYDKDVMSSDGKSEPVLLRTREFIQEIRKRNVDVPIYLYGQTKTSYHIPNDILCELRGFIHMFEDTPQFIARHIIRQAKNYLEGLKPPFFKALLEHTEDGSYSWHCPGHSGGVAFLKSPVGQLFHQFFGENMLRADVCNAVEELGQLLDHTGPIAASERNAARIFNADHCFFVTNGTSTSNKIVWHHAVGTNDVVVVDRNCHKSIIHAIIMTGAIPVFLKPTRNHFGIIGPIPKAEFDQDAIREKIASHPLVEKHWGKEEAAKLHPRILTLTQSTYDGVLYNASQIKSNLNGFVDALHFDEAWLPHAAFHPLYEHYYAMHSAKERLDGSLVYATQSSHKSLAGLSQASHVLIQDSSNAAFDWHLFNEAYLMHTSTSPQYSIMASCDVAAAMMEFPGGQALVEESIAESLTFRRAMLKIEEELNGDWWFKVWGPSPSADQEVPDINDWMLQAENPQSLSNDIWHGFGEVAEGFNMLDPIKCTIITPGLDLKGIFAPKGIPASVVTKFLSEHGVVVEKTGLYSFFIMFTIGITKGRWNGLVTALQVFKEAFAKNQPLWRVLPKFTQAHPWSKQMGLADLCHFMHEIYARHDIAKLTTEIYLSELSVAMKPSDAYVHIAQKKIERVAIDDLEGRVSVGLITPYPPGIPLLIPGEIFNRSIVNYLKFSRELNRHCPGFETDTHGVVKEQTENDTTQYFVYCVKQG